MSRQALQRRTVADTVWWTVLIGATVHLAHGMGGRLDVTSDGRHTLSPAAERAAESLRAPVVARAYLSRGLAAPYHEHRDAALQVLRSLSDASDGRLIVVDHDPTDAPTVASEAREVGIRPVPYIARDGDRQEQRVVFLGAQLEQEGRRVVLDVLPSVERMEYELVRGLVAVDRIREDRPVIGWVVGHGEPDPSSLPEAHPLAEVAAELALRGELETVHLDEPVAADVLVWVGPQRPVSAAAQARVDEHVAGGGAVVAFVGSVRPSAARPDELVEVPHGLQRWFGHYGAVLQPGVLFDRLSHEALARPGQRAVPHPLAPVSRHIDRSVPAVRDLERLVLPFASAVTLAEALPPDVVGESWVRTGAASARVADPPPSLPPAAWTAALPDELPGPHPVMVALSGRFPSRDPAGSPGRPGRLVVVGSADAAANNPAWVLNLVDWALDDATLWSIRARGGPAPALVRPSHPLRVKAAMLTPGVLGLLLWLAWAMRRAR